MICRHELAVGSVGREGFSQKNDMKKSLSNPTTTAHNVRTPRRHATLKHARNNLFVEVLELQLCFVTNTNRVENCLTLVTRYQLLHGVDNQRVKHDITEIVDNSVNVTRH